MATKIFYQLYNIDDINTVENGVSVSVSVIYLDSATKSTQVSQFDLILEKSDNWKILK